MVGATLEGNIIQKVLLLLLGCFPVYQKRTRERGFDAQ